MKLDQCIRKPSQAFASLRKQLLAFNYLRRKSCWWDDDQGKYIYQEEDSVSLSETIWKYEMQFNCATWAMDLPEFPDIIF